VNDLNRRSATQSRNAVPGEVSGVLETLAAGFSLVVSKPYLFLLPLLLDVWTWLGVQISPSALIVPLQDLMIDQGGSNGTTAAEELGELGARMRVNDVVASLTPSIFSGLPSDSLLNTVIGLLAPALTEGVDRSKIYASWGEGLGRSIDPAHWYGVVAIGFLLFVVATMMLSLFKVPIAQAVRGGSVTVGSFAKDVFLGWIRVVALLGVIIAAIVVIGIPLIIAAQVLVLIGINLIAVLSLALFVFGSVGALYTYFLLDAMFIYRVGPIRAARMSFAVARMNFAQSWRFAAASLLIATGMLQVWGVIVENPPGIILAILVNAVLGTGLSIASMMFFHDRARLPRPHLNSRHIPSSRPFPPR
jgi:hypothetical protein